MLSRELLLERQILYPEIADQWADTAATRITRGGWGHLNDTYEPSWQDEILEEWCRRVLRNWLIRDYEGVERVTQLSDYQYYHPDHTPFGGAEDVQPPEWFTRGLEAGQEFYALPNVPYQPRDIEQITEKAGEILRSLLGQMEQRGQTQPQIRQRILRVSVPAMLDLWQREHDRIAHEAAKARKLMQTREGGGLRKLVTLPGGLTAFEFVSDQPQGHPSKILRAALRDETTEMGICVGQFDDNLQGGLGELYAAGVEMGAKRIFSLRDAQGQSHVTIDTVNNKISQVKGKQNEPPVAKYVPDTLSFLNHLGLSARSGDLRELRIFERQGRYSTDFREVAAQVMVLDDGTEVWEVESLRGPRLWFLYPEESGQMAAEPFFALGLTQREDGSEPYINDVDRQFGSGTEPIRKNMDLILAVLNDGTYRPTPSWAEYIARAGCIQDPETHRWDRYENIATLVGEIGEFKIPGSLDRTGVYHLYHYANRYEIMAMNPDRRTGETLPWRAMTIIVRDGHLENFQVNTATQWGREPEHKVILANALNLMGVPARPLDSTLRSFGIYCSGTRYGLQIEDVGKLVMRFEGNLAVYQLEDATHRQQRIYVVLDHGRFAAVIVGNGEDRTVECGREWTHPSSWSSPPLRRYWRHIRVLCQRAGLEIAGPTEMIGTSDLE